MPEPTSNEPRLDICFALASAVASKQLAAKSNPIDERVDTFLLDLRDSEPQHAQSALESIAVALAPQLYLQAEKSWIVATGDILPADAARIIAEQFLALGYKKNPIAIIRGESFTNRLEELASEGADLSDDTGCSLLEYRDMPVSVLTNAPTEPIADALSAGAQIVLTQIALPGTMALATYGSQLSGASLPLDTAASVASAADLLSALGQDLRNKETSSTDMVMAKTNNHGACSLENLSEETIHEVLLHSKHSNRLPEVTYNSQWKAESKTSLQLDSIESRKSSDEACLSVKVLEKYRLDFKARFAEACNYEHWHQATRLLISSEIHFCCTKLSDSGDSEYLITLESQKRLPLESAAKQIELLCLVSHGGPYLDGSLIQSIQHVFRTFDLSVTIERPSDVFEFQHQMRTVEDWIE